MGYLRSPLGVGAQSRGVFGRGVVTYIVSEMSWRLANTGATVDIWTGSDGL